MRRFVTFVALLLFTLPFGIAISGCSKKTTVVYCNGGDSGAVVGQLTTITLTPKLYGISLNQAAIGQITAPTARWTARAPRCPRVPIPTRRRI